MSSSLSLFSLLLTFVVVVAPDGVPAASASVVGIVLVFALDAACG